MNVADITVEDQVKVESAAEVKDFQGDAPKISKSPQTPKRKQADDDSTPSKKAKSVQGTPARAKIAESVDELTAEDQMMITWKDGGKPWSEIKAEWERLTGKKPGGSTLPNRYARLKANLTCVATEDIPHLMAAEVESVQQIEAECKDLWAKKWARIAKIMEEKGTANYSSTTIEKQFKKISNGAATRYANSGQDGDPAESF